MDGGIVGNPEEVGVDPEKLREAIELLQEQRKEGLHNGAQLFAARRGQTVVDVATGEARPGVRLQTDSAMLWFSSTKPLTAVAIAQQVERGKLKLDDRVASFIPEFGNGKESATVEHVLTHTAGFPMGEFPFLRYDWETAIQKICEEPAEYEPGTAAGYHPLSGWCILGEIVRQVDGRPIDVYLKEELFQPLGMKESSLGVTPERAAELGDRLSQIKDTATPPPNMESWNDPRARVRILPGGNGYGPAHDLARLYLALWNGGEWDGARILDKATVDLFTATHREGMADRTFSTEDLEVKPAWGLGIAKGTDAQVVTAYGRHSTASTFGHGGARSSVGFVEPNRDLVCVVVTNGLPTTEENALRLCDVSDTIHNACR